MKRLSTALVISLTSLGLWVACSSGDEAGDGASAGQAGSGAQSAAGAQSGASGKGGAAGKAGASGAGAAAGGGGAGGGPGGAGAGGDDPGGQGGVGGGQGGAGGTAAEGGASGASAGAAGEPGGAGAGGEPGGAGVGGGGAGGGAGGGSAGVAGAPPATVRCLDQEGACSFAFSAGRLTANNVADEFVQIGFYHYEQGTSTACSFTGPTVKKLYWHWARGDRPAGKCAEDPYGKPSRWDHASASLDSCPKASAWSPASAVLNDCPMHLTAGFARSDAMHAWTGNYQYEPEKKLLTFRFLNESGVCRKEYWQVNKVTLDGSTTELVSLVLDGVSTGDTSPAHRGTGNTHGFAFGSSQSTTAFVPQSEVIARYTGPTKFLTREASLYANKLAVSKDGPQGTWVACEQQPSVMFQYSCHADDAGTSPDLVACNPTGGGKDPGGAFLKYIGDAFSSNTRYNVWNGFHALLTQGAGCYHSGLHSVPMIQVMGSSGAFRGWVGIEYQENYPLTDDTIAYLVQRRIEEGYFTP